MPPKDAWEFFFITFKALKKITKISYCNKNVTMKVISSDDFKNKYDAINNHIDEYIQIVQLSLQSTVS